MDKVYDIIVRIAVNEGSNKRSGLLLNLSL